MQDTIQALREFRNKKEHINVDSCIVVFMSHGSKYTMSSLLIGVFVLGISPYSTGGSHSKIFWGKITIVLFLHCRQTKFVKVMLTNKKTY